MVYTYGWSIVGHKMNFTYSYFLTTPFQFI